MKIVALIPARAGSKRIPGKNTKHLCGEPLIAYAIAAAIESDAFTDVMVCTDDDAIVAGTLKNFPMVNLRVRDIVPDEQPDIEWVSDALDVVTAARGRYPEALSILRPTSPFRTADTIRRAVAQFKRSECHSLRAVELVKETPYKMWTWEGPGYPILPLMPDLNPQGVPYHSTPTQTHPKVYRQNASLELVWSWVVRDLHSLSGSKVVPFFTEGYEGLDINTPEDWLEAERIAAAHPELLPNVPTPV